MKKIVCLILAIALFTIPAFAADIDFASLSEEELQELQTKTVRELENRSIEVSGLLTGGEYVGGEDIQSGQYVFSLPKEHADDATIVYLYDNMEDCKNEENEVESGWVDNYGDLSFAITDGQVLVIRESVAATLISASEATDYVPDGEIASLSDDELKDLQTQTAQELSNRSQEAAVVLKEGNYVGGADIRAGWYIFTLPEESDDHAALVYLFENMDDCENSENKLESGWVDERNSLSFAIGDGQVLRIREDVVATPVPPLPFTPDKMTSSADVTADDIAEPASLEDKSAASKKPFVYFSEWESEPVSDTMNVYSRDITVSDGGNFLMTYLDIKGDRYYYYYDAIWQGKGRQKVFSHDWDSEEIRIGKIFRFESMDECGMDIDQIITDHISIQASDGSSFILIFRPNGGKYDGTVQTITVMNGRRDLTADSYQETQSIELLGVFRFLEEERSALHFDQNVIQPDSTGFQIQMALTADVDDGIALMVYTNASGNEVCVVQPIIGGYGVLTAYDSAETVEDIKVGRFGIIGFSYDVADALFEGIDFDHAAEPVNTNQQNPDTVSADVNSFLTGGLPKHSSQSQGTGTLAGGEHSITLVGDVFVDCPESAKAGETVTVHTGEMADGEIIVEMNGTRIDKTGWGTYTFTMPDEDVELKGWSSTAGFSGS